MQAKKKNNEQHNNLGALIAIAIGVGVANSVALNDPAVGFGITCFIIGMIVLGLSFRKHAQE